MITRGSVRRKSREVFQKVIELRKKGFSYSEIIKETNVAKSTINNWITFAGLNLSPEHLRIQQRKRIENYVVATEASRITRLNRKLSDIQNFISKYKEYFNDPFFNYGIAIFESEGSKSTDCKFSNSDYRLIITFIKFIEKYFDLNRQSNMSFSLFIHESRKNDLIKILAFWAKKVDVSKNKFYVYWKKNKIVGRRENKDYLGQISVRIMGERILGSKLLAISDIILKKYLK